MKYLIYCRKSSEENSRQVQSLDTQQRILTSMAFKLKLNVTDIIRESRSAKTDQNRPLFTAMLERIRNGEADGILTVNVDRLARNFIEAGYVIKLVDTNILKEIKTPDITYKNDRTFTYLCDDFAKATNYSKDLSLKVKAGNESKLLRGEYPGSAPLGYINIFPGKGIKPDPIRAPLITKAFYLYSMKNHSLSSLRKKLIDDGFRSRRGNKISRSVLRGILTNPIYYGIIKRKNKMYEGVHEPLTSKTIFDEVKSILADRVKGAKKKLEFTYRDFLSCDECGCKITAGLTKGKYIYYRCTNSKGICNQHKKYQKKETVYKEFKNFVSNFTLDPIRANKAFNLYKKKTLEDSDYQKNSSEAINQQISNLTNRIKRSENAYIEDRISGETLDQKKIEFQNEINQLKVIAKQQNKQNAEITLELVEEIKNKAIQLDIIFEDGDDQVRRDLLKSLVWNSKFKDGKITSTRVNKLWEPLEGLNDIQDINVWWAIQDSNL